MILHVAVFCLFLFPLVLKPSVLYLKLSETPKFIPIAIGTKSQTNPNFQLSISKNAMDRCLIFDELVLDASLEFVI